MKLKVVKIVEIVCSCLALIFLIGFSFFILQKMLFENKPMKLAGITIYEVNKNELFNEDDKTKKGDLIITFKKKNYQENDIILFIESEEYNLSRITSKNDNILSIVKYGLEDGADIEVSSVVGKKVLMIHNYAKFKQFVLNPITIIGTGVVFFGGFITCFILEKVFSNNDDNEKNKIEKEENNNIKDSK